MAKQKKHSAALNLRKTGYSIGAIAKELEVSKSTVSLWCKDIALSDQQLKLIAENSKHHATHALLRAAEKMRVRRLENIASALKNGSHDVGILNKRDIFMVGLGLYWGEGYKKGSQEMGFTNSDPAMITFYIEWLTRIYKIKKIDLILRISINNQHVLRERKIINYWSKVTGIPATQFTKTSFIKVSSKKIYIDPENHFGTLRIKVRRGTELRRRVLGSIASLKI